jgi:hypothetical protein
MTGSEQVLLPANFADEVRFRIARSGGRRCGWHSACCSTPPEFFYFGPNPKAFGTAGAGGSFAMADRDNHLGVGYSLNPWWPALALGDRARAIVDSVYASL